MKRNQHTGKTHCHKGHPFDAQNTRVQANGSRQCIKCHRVLTNEWRRRKRLEQVHSQATLTTTEVDVWDHVAQGLTNSQIAKELGYSKSHIENIINSLFSKFNCTNRVQLAQLHWSNTAVNIKKVVKKELLPFEFHCLRCGENFRTRSETPAQCAECGNQYWDTARKHGASP